MRIPALIMLAAFGLALAADPLAKPADESPRAENSSKNPYLPQGAAAGFLRCRLPMARSSSNKACRRRAWTMA